MDDTFVLVKVPNIIIQYLEGELCDEVEITERIRIAIIEFFKAEFNAENLQDLLIILEKIQENWR